MAELAALPGMRMASQVGLMAVLDEDHPVRLDRAILHRVKTHASDLHNHVARGITCRVTKNNARAVGVGMVPFTSQRRSESYDVMGEEAAVVALPVVNVNNASAAGSSALFLIRQISVNACPAVARIRTVRYGRSRQDV
ncbi:MAG: hypothetical protein JWR34_2775 [Mycobacterium sp.]|nr:hypothetical protein [Mycobacterium sp.]